ncbi:MAG TPA: hypothetical protein VKZ89_06765 [Thermobifida alba]|nr:hypothetical protein [Thermobifida alba]
MRSLHRLVADAEIALRGRAARARRAWLGTRLIEDTPGHPEHVRDIDPESQDAFDALMLAVVAEGDPAARRLMQLAIRAGWAR